MEENRKNKGETQFRFAKIFGIPASTLSRILAKKEDISKRFEDGDSRKRDADFPDVDEAVLHFFKQARTENISIPGPVLQGKAEFPVKNFHVLLDILLDVLLDMFIYFCISKVYTFVYAGKHVGKICGKMTK